MEEPRWKPEYGEEFYFVDSTGHVGRVMNCINLECAMSEFGNCFKTKEEAEAAAEKVKALLLSLQHNELPKPTYGDKIRKMSNKDLAEMLVYPVNLININGNIYYEFISCLLPWPYPMRDQAVFLTEKRLNAPAGTDSNVPTNTPATAEKGGEDEQ